MEVQYWLQIVCVIQSRSYDLNKKLGNPWCVLAQAEVKREMGGLFPGSQLRDQHEDSSKRQLSVLASPQVRATKQQTHRQQSWYDTVVYVKGPERQ